MAMDSMVHGKDTLSTRFSPERAHTSSLDECNSTLGGLATTNMTDGYAQVLGYSGSFLSTVTITVGSNTYVKTYGNDGTNITSIPVWVKTS